MVSDDRFTVDVVVHPVLVGAVRSTSLTDDLARRVLARLVPVEPTAPSRGSS